MPTLQPRITATDRRHLEQLIRVSLEVNGKTCDLNHIDVSGIETMDSLFETFRAFNGDMSQWDTSSVKSMSGMFYHADFNGDISGWNTSNVVTMTQMFTYSAFTGDISGWDASNVHTMGLMFASSKFSGDISSWVLRSDVVLDGLCNNNPGFLAAQWKVAPWMVGLYIQKQTLPADPQWAQAFMQVEPVARGLSLGLSQHVQAIVQAYERIVASDAQHEVSIALSDILVN